MKLLQLNYFQTVCRVGSTVHAAAVLSVSQPTISAAIKELEREFGVPLFWRRGKSLELTPQGRVLMELSGDLLRQAEEVERVMKGLAQTRSTIRLGITPMLAALFLPGLYRELTGRLGEMDVEIREGSKFQLFEQLRDREIDLAITGHGAPDGKEFHSLLITRLEYAFYVAGSHPLADRSRVTIEDIRNEPVAVFRRSYQGETTAKYFAQYGDTPRIVYESDQLSTICGLVAGGAMTAILYRGLSRQYEDLRAIPLDPPVVKPIGLFWRKDSPPLRDMERLLRCIRSIQGNDDSAGVDPAPCEGAEGPG